MTKYDFLLVKLCQFINGKARRYYFDIGRTLSTYRNLAKQSFGRLMGMEMFFRYLFQNLLIYSSRKKRIRKIWRTEGESEERSVFNFLFSMFCNDVINIFPMNVGMLFFLADDLEPNITNLLCVS